MPERQIVGIVLARNEDLQIRQAVENVAAFCDRLILCDHGSTDGTAEIFADLTARHSQIEAHRLIHSRESHALLEVYAGSEAWIFGVDGDEIYDPARLAVLRTQLLGGRYSDSWMILGNVLNCDFVDPAGKTAAGWLAPPCRSITKLYNFSVIRSWSGVEKERLHGGFIDFAPGHHASDRLYLHEKTSWEEAPLRCLHTCFVPRSSLDQGQLTVRENIMDQHHSGLLGTARRWWKNLRGVPVESAWKKSRYMRGERVTIDARAFFP